MNALHIQYINFLRSTSKCCYILPLPRESYVDHVLGFSKLSDNKMATGPLMLKCLIMAKTFNGLVCLTILCSYLYTVGDVKSLSAFLWGGNQKYPVGSRPIWGKLWNSTQSYHYHQSLLLVCFTYSLLIRDTMKSFVSFLSNPVWHPGTSFSP